MTQERAKNKQILARIQQRLNALGISEREAGLRAGSASLIRQFRTGIEKDPERSLATRSVERIAKALDTSYEWLSGGAGPDGDEAHEPMPPPRDTQGLPLDAFQRDLPILGSAAGSIVSGVAGLKIGRRPDGYILRPPRLAGIPNAYAVRVTGRSMEPMLLSGALCIVDPNATAAPGDVVIVQTQTHDGDPGQAYVKILRNRHGPRITLEQLNPLATLEIPREYVSSIHRVLTVGDLFEDAT